MKTQIATEEKGLTELQIKAIAHYDRMIIFARMREKICPTESKDYATMKFFLTEAWSAKDCAYCLKYQKESGLYQSCGYCPLFFCGQCCGGLWDNLNRAETWGEWVAAAEKVKEYIIEHGGKLK